MLLWTSQHLHCQKMILISNPDPIRSSSSSLYKTLENILINPFSTFVFHASLISGYVPMVVKCGEWRSGRVGAIWSGFANRKGFRWKTHQRFDFGVKLLESNIFIRKLRPQFIILYFCLVHGVAFRQIESSTEQVPEDQS